ncbi:MAG: ribosome silencing factor [Lachnospiraceae bacterium]|nr:ribosome silencing factor [Lachnospiraceae bacterium]
MDSREKAKLIVKALDDKKGKDIKVIDISEISVIADYFIIADGSNINQVQAMANNVEEVLGKEKVQPKQIEGYRSGNWILMDYHDVIVHIFMEEDRLFYDLERIWRDGKDVSIANL